MKDPIKKSRRSFIRKLGSGSVMAGAMPAWMASGFETQKHYLKNKRHSAANDQINLAVIGTGIMGFNNVRTALEHPGVKLVAACDLYTGRLSRINEVYGKEVATTKNFEEILDRDDVDAVCIATTDHWHDRMSIRAMEKGKAVYCEKPMVHHIEEGKNVINKQKSTGVPFQVGSQRVSSLIYLKAKELYEAGDIGQLNLVETWIDRQSALGAWQYSIPPDASEKTVDWKRYQGDAPPHPFDLKRFFWWRNYQDYGTGMAGDLFVHLFSGMHLVLSSNGPSRIYATGGLRYWEDGRDVPDVMIAAVDYPETSSHPAFNLQIRVNFVDGKGGGNGLRLIGSEGVIEIGGNSVTLIKNKISKQPGYGGWDSFFTFPVTVQEEFEKQYQERYPEERPTIKDPVRIVYEVEEGYSDHFDHWGNFLAAIRDNKKIKEDAVYGFRAAAAALACNKSYFENRVIGWDPVNMKLV